MSNSIFSGKSCKQTTEYLLKRRSCPIKWIDDPGPNHEQIKTILTAASRVPDHGKMFPWYFIVIEGEKRKIIGQAIREIFSKEEPETPEAKLELEANRFLRAPCVIGVVSKIRKGKHPMWEQLLSAGAACQNLCLAANSLGYASNWLTEWYSYNEEFKKYLGIEKNEHVAGFIYIGTANTQPEDRPRPDIKEITTFWEPDTTLNKGNSYGYPDMGMPKKGFQFEE
jgi:nitroreductase